MQYTHMSLIYKQIWYCPCIMEYCLYFQHIEMEKHLELQSIDFLSESDTIHSRDKKNLRRAKIGSGRFIHINVVIEGGINMFVKELDYDTYAAKIYTPEWFRAERYEYCEQSAGSKKAKTRKRFHLPIHTFFSFFL